MNGYAETTLLIFWIMLSLLIIFFGGLYLYAWSWGAQRRARAWFIGAVGSLGFLLGGIGKKMVCWSLQKIENMKGETE